MPECQIKSNVSLVKRLFHAIQVRVHTLEIKINLRAKKDIIENIRTGKHITKLLFNEPKQQLKAGFFGSYRMDLRIL